MIEPRRYRAGQEIEDVCRVCKADRMHTIVAVDPAGKPIRVACGYCRGEHNYRGVGRATTSTRSSSGSSSGSLRKSAASAPPAPKAPIFKPLNQPPAPSPWAHIFDRGARPASTSSGPSPVPRPAPREGATPAQDETPRASDDDERGGADDLDLRRGTPGAFTPAASSRLDPLDEDDDLLDDEDAASEADDDGDTDADTDVDGDADADAFGSGGGIDRDARDARAADAAAALAARSAPLGRLRDPRADDDVPIAARYGYGGDSETDADEDEESDDRRDLTRSSSGLVHERTTPVAADPNANDLANLEWMLRRVIREETGLTTVTPAARWRGGQLVLRSGKAELQEKAWPIDTFFHKIVMLRNRLRTLEQQINAMDIPEDEKARLQSYITGCYGSLTSFNVLFADEQDQFKGTGGE